MMLNENIKTLRISRNMNQVEFAKALCVTKQCVSNWENDNVVPSIDMLCKIADFFLMLRQITCSEDKKNGLLMFLFLQKNK